MDKNWISLVRIPLKIKKMGIMYIKNLAVFLSLIIFFSDCPGECA